MFPSTACPISGTRLLPQLQHKFKCITICYMGILPKCFVCFHTAPYDHHPHPLENSKHIEHALHLYLFCIAMRYWINQSTSPQPTITGISATHPDSTAFLSTQIANPIVNCWCARWLHLIDESEIAATIVKYIDSRTEILSFEKSLLCMERFIGDNKKLYFCIYGGTR